MARKNLVLEDVEILPVPFRNFSGKPTKFNAEGDRNFCVIIPEELAKMLMDDDWTVKVLNKRSDDEEDRYYIKVKVRYNSNRKPKIVLITSGGNTMLDEESVDILDWSDIEKADISINPYESDVRGKHYVSGYLKSLYVTIDEDDLDKKYADIEYGDLPVAGDAVEDEDIPF